MCFQLKKKGKYESIKANVNNIKYSKEFTLYKLYDIL